MAADVAAAGIKTVTGKLVADDTRFDSQRLGRSWAADDESAYYSSQISALSLAPDTDYDTGNVIVEMVPGSTAGEKPKVKVTPSNDYVDVDVTAPRPSPRTARTRSPSTASTVATPSP